jgi:lipopolysaccharide export LptBFGC system permease protein LptF
VSPKRIARTFVLSGIAIVILAAGILSFSALRRLGISAGWNPGLAALLPVSIDV